MLGNEITFETFSELYAWLAKHSGQSIIIEGMEDAIVGMIASEGKACLVYDVSAILKILQDDLEMSESDATVYFERKILPMWAEHRNPCFIKSLPKDLRAD
jgi:hypothetical protein